jgi:hypothetical protein
VDEVSSRTAHRGVRTAIFVFVGVAAASIGGESCPDPGDGASGAM